MATYLYRLGRWAFDDRRKVLLGWLAVLGLVIASASAFSGDSRASSRSRAPNPSAPRTCCIEKYPGAGGASARVVFAAPEGERLTAPANRAAVLESVAEARKADGVVLRHRPVPGEGALGGRPHRLRRRDLSDARRRGRRRRPRRARGERRARHGRRPQVEFGGGLVTDESEAGSESARHHARFLVLAITLGRCVAAGLPLLTAILGVGDRRRRRSPRSPASSS